MGEVDECQNIFSADKILHDFPDVKSQIPENSMIEADKWQIGFSAD